jgi:GT2 family glycosyltransferase
VTRDVLIIVPTRGERRDLLDTSVRSIAAQTVVPRIVVITRSGADGLRAQWTDLPTVSVLTQQSSGLSAAINEAWQADGWASDLTGWLGDDDALPPWSVQEAIAVLDRQPRAAAVHGPCLVVDEHGSPVRVYRNGRLGAALAGYGVNLIAQPGSLFRTAAVRAVGGLDESLALAMDVDLFVRLRTQGPIASARRQLGVFREHATGLSTQQAISARAESTSSMRRAHAGRRDAVLHAVAGPVTRVVGLVNRTRPPRTSSYWAPSDAQQVPPQP